MKLITLESVIENLKNGMLYKGEELQLLFEIYDIPTDSICRFNYEGEDYLLEEVGVGFYRMINSIQKSSLEEIYTKQKRLEQVYKLIKKYFK